MHFTVKQEGSTVKVGIADEDDVILFESTKNYRGVDDAFKDMQRIAYSLRKSSITIKDISGEEEESN